MRWEIAKVDSNGGEPDPYQADIAERDRAAEAELRLAQIAYDVKTREDFVSFLNTLAQDFRDERASWQQSTIPAFLEATAAWTRRWDEPLEWSFVARLLLGGSRHG